MTSHRKAVSLHHNRIWHIWAALSILFLSAHFKLATHETLSGNENSCSHFLHEERRRPERQRVIPRGYWINDGDSTSLPIPTLELLPNSWKREPTHSKRVQPFTHLVRTFFPADLGNESQGCSAVSLPWNLLSALFLKPSFSEWCEDPSARYPFYSVKQHAPSTTWL